MNIWRELETCVYGENMKGAADDDKRRSWFRACASLEEKRQKRKRISVQKHSVAQLIIIFVPC